MPLEVVAIGQQVPLGKIGEKGSAQKVRKETADQGLGALLKSMKAHGQIHAVSIVENGDGSYELANGHRRFAAAARGDFPSLRANIYRVPKGEEENREVLIQQHLYAANMAEPLIEVERARMFDALMNDFGFDVERVAEVFEGETPESVARTLKFLAIDETVLDIVAANLDKFSPGHLEILADYASPATKHSWRMKPAEQVKIARELADQADKQMVRDPRKLETRIKALVKERRDRERTKNTENKKAQTDPVKALFKAVEGVEAAAKNLTGVDLDLIREIDPADKGAAIKRLYDAVEEIASFNDTRLNKVKIRNAAA